MPAQQAQLSPMGCIDRGGEGFDHRPTSCRDPRARSPSTISRALAQGRLKYADPTRKLLVRQGLNSGSRTPPDLKLTARKK